MAAERAHVDLDAAGRLRAVDHAEDAVATRERGDSAIGMRRPVEVMTWLTLIARVAGVSAAAKRCTSAAGSWSVGAIAIVSTAMPVRWAR